MRSFAAIKLRFLSPLHVGEPGVGVEKVLSLTIHSDTLWAAVLYGWNRLGYDPDPLLPPDDQPDWEPPFRLSSAFPWLGETFFFPRPVGPLPFSEAIEPHRWKEVKKVKFFPQAVLERWANGEPLDGRAVKELLLAWKDLGGHVAEYTEPHVRLGHASFASQIYYLGVSSFRKEAGLYFLLQWRDESLKDRFLSVLNFLQEEGIGGKRARGFGLFEWEETSLSLRLPDEGERWLLLSTLIPEEDLVAKLRYSTFQLYRSRGWAMSPTGEQAFRKPIWMILEGATFPMRPRGRVIDVTPEDWHAPHRVFRHGVAFCLPVKGVKG